MEYGRRLKRSNRIIKGIGEWLDPPTHKSNYIMQMIWMRITNVINPLKVIINHKLNY